MCPELQLNAPNLNSMSYDSLKDVQSGLGTGVVIVMKKSTNIVAAIARFTPVSPILRCLFLAKTLLGPPVTPFIVRAASHVTEHTPSQDDLSTPHVFCSLSYAQLDVATR